MSNISVRKKSGIIEHWDSMKIIKAISKSAERIATTLSDIDKENIVNYVEDKITKDKLDIVPIERVHAYVEIALSIYRPDVAESYRNYRNWVKKNADMMAKVNEKCNSLQFMEDRSNGNADSMMCSTKRVKKLDILETEQYIEYFLNADEKTAVRDGYIYPHDKGARLDTANCCLADVETIITDGFEMNNMWYTEPKTVKTAFSVIGDITLMMASQQYGGFTIPEIDHILSRYVEKSYLKYYNEILPIYMESVNTLTALNNENNIDYVNKVTNDAYSKAEEYSLSKVRTDLRQGFQGWEYKFNTVASSRGDYPFITISFGAARNKWGREICKAVLEVRKNGQGKKGKKKPVLFPKLVFLYDENLHGIGMEYEDVFEAAIDCSMKACYPDFLSLTGEGYVPSMYKMYGKIISPMGCRAFLSPWYERGGMYPADETDIPVFIGRSNIGVVSLNLPMIYDKSIKEGTDFFDELTFYLEMIRRIHLRTYDYLGHMKASLNPLGFCEGGFYGGHLKLDDKIEPVIKSWTASFGITALNELQRLYNGKSIAEDGQFAMVVMDFINKKISEFKSIDHKLYAIYGSPAESLCHTQVEQFRKKYGIITNVSDREYMSNSFHCHVTEDITPSEKQDLEKRFWNYFNGGKIQYVRYRNNYNKESFRTFIRRAMKMGFYEGQNLSLAYCEECGHEELDMDVCPCCGSKNLTKIDRVSGYLAFSRTHGNTRLNEGKMAEIKERLSM